MCRRPASVAVGPIALYRNLPAPNERRSTDEPRRRDHRTRCHKLRAAHETDPCGRMLRLYHNFPYTLQTRKTFKSTKNSLNCLIAPVNGCDIGVSGSTAPR